MIAVGCDWARKKHQLVVLSESNEELACFSVPHNAAGLREIAERLEALESDRTAIRIGIEGHDGPLMDWLEDQDYTVIAVNPKTSCAARNLLSSSGSKDDRLDARALAQLVRLESHRVSPRHRPEPTRRAVAMVLRQRERRVRERGDLVRRIGQLLQEWAPALAELCGDLDLVWTRDFLARWPLEQDLHSTDARTLRRFASKHRLRKQSVEKILEARKREPLPLRSERLPGLRRELHYRLAHLAAVRDQIGALETELKGLVEADPAHEILDSLPGASTVLRAAWIAAFAAAPTEESTWQSVSAHAGVSPVTQASGSLWSVRCRRSRDPMLQRLLTYYAFQTARIEDSWARELYTTKRARGKAHYTTLRGIAQRWVKIVHALLRDQTPYSEDIHRDRRNHCQRKAA